VKENFIDFRAIKQLVSMQLVLDRYNIQFRKVNQHSLRGKCPLPTHTSDKSSESFGVHLGKNIWACQSSSCSAARQGKKGGNVLDFVAFMEHCSVHDAAKKLQDWFASGHVFPIQTKDQATREEKHGVAEEKQGSDDGGINKPLTFSLKGVDPSHGYIQQRGIKEDTARHFGIGCFSGRGSMSGRLVIPIHDDRGELVAYAGRSIDGTEPKYNLPAGFHKSAELFNLHRARAIENQQVILVEGFFDCMKVHQAGFPFVVALMGSSLSQAQHQRLLTFKEVILFLDGDEAGREATKAVANRLIYSHKVRAISLVNGGQPDQMSSEKLRRLLEPIV